MNGKLKIKKCREWKLHKNSSQIDNFPLKSFVQTDSVDIHQFFVFSHFSSSSRNGLNHQLCSKLDTCLFSSTIANKNVEWKKALEMNSNQVVLFIRQKSWEGFFSFCHFCYRLQAYWNSFFYILLLLMMIVFYMFVVIRAWTSCLCT